MILDLNDGNFLLYAAKNYHHLMQAEFLEDLKRVKYIKRLLNNYRKTGEFRERLVLNHIIVLGNVFGVEPTVNILFLKCDAEDYPLVKTLLLYLNYLPDNLTVTINGLALHLREIPVDLIIAGKLREI